MRRFALLFAVPPLLVLFLVVLPLVLGTRTLYLRDVMNAHLPLKASQAEAFRQGELPLVDLHRGGGQPLLGNPNGLPLYPDNLLLLVADPLWVVNAHFVLHWLLAPLAFFWLGRAFGLARGGAFAAGMLYATGGYFLSLLNFYNLVAVGALVPAFLAAALDAGRDAATARRRGGWPLVALLFCLLLLAGDPFSALLALALLALALAQRDGARSLLRPPAGLLAALALGALISLPMWVELARILPGSFRASISQAPAVALSQSLRPAQAIEGLFPLFFGRFDHSFWGRAVYDQGQPFLVSIFPGLLALALLPLALRRGDHPPAWRFGWAALLLGLFFALGRFNPLVLLLYQLPGVGVLHYPVKFLLLSAVGLALLGGLAAERLLQAGAWRRLRPVLLLALLAYLGFFLLVLLAPAILDALLHLFDPRLPPELLAAQRARLGAIAVTLSAAAAAMWLATWLAGRSARAALALLLTLQAATQVVLLESLLETDDAAIYRGRPAPFARLPPEALIAHAAFAGGAFGELRLDSRKLPDFRQLWQARCHHEELGAPAGIYFGRGYDLNFSPEGLDSRYGVFLGKWLAGRSDADRVRVLAASGVDLVVLPRALAGVAAEEASLLLEFPSACHGTMRVYRLERVLPPFGFPGGTRRAESAAAAAGMLASPSFDPRREAVLVAPAGTAPAAAAGAPDGLILELEERRELIAATVESRNGGVFTTRRAFLPIYRAEIDGRPAPVQLVNGHRLGVELPPGRHQLLLYADRRPTRAAFAVAGLALAGLAAWFFKARRGRPPLTE